MWAAISKILIQIVISIISDKVVVEASKRLVNRAVDSAVNGVGITDKDAKDLIHSIADSGLNNITKSAVSSLLR